MYTVCTMHAIFVVHCRVNMKPLNHTLLTNLQLCSDQSINQSQFLVWDEGAPKNTFARSPYVYRSVPAFKCLISCTGCRGIHRLSCSTSPRVLVEHTRTHSCMQKKRNGFFNSLKCVIKCFRTRP